MTGFYRDGFCQTGPQDTGSHTVCSQVTAEFLSFSKKIGNDLSTPRPEYGFPGLKPGDKWCVCVSRWEEAFMAGVAPPIVLESTHERALDVVELAELDAIPGRVRRAHVNVPLVPNDAALQVDHPRGPEQIAAGRIAMIAALPYRRIDAERDGIGKR